MNSVHDQLRQDLLARANVSEAVLPADLRRSEWSPEFERLMRNRLVLGALRYGRIHAVGKPTYDRAESIIRRARKYQETGNLELLVDVANLCLLEFEEGQHPQRHFAAEDDGEHVQVARV